ncbi:MAG: hypothetical protein ACRC1K_07450, partial [Planctomycetia bacterium]
MSKRWANVALLGLALTSCSCAWVRSRSDFERDPFVMSHLTHGKGDPTYAATENESSLSSEGAAGRSPVTAASLSKKPGSGATGSVKTVGGGSSLGGSGAAEDFRWIEGRMVYRSGKKGGWAVRFGAPGDRYGGEIAVADAAKLGVAREGDL